MLKTAIHIIDLRLKAIIGTNDWERKKKQLIIINVDFEFSANNAIVSDNIADTVDYKALKMKIIALVNNSSYQLLETLTYQIMNLTLEQPAVQNARVRVEKPRALRFAKSVAVEMTGSKISAPPGPSALSNEY